MNELVARTIFTAFVLAHQAGATEIDLDHLLSALDTPLPKRRQPTDGPFMPVPRQDLPLSNAARTAFKRLNKFDTATADDIRAILIATRAAG